MGVEGIENISNQHSLTVILFKGSYLSSLDTGSEIYTLKFQLSEHLKKEQFHLYPINWLCEGVKKKTAQECSDGKSEKDETILTRSKNYLTGSL